MSPILRPTKVCYVRVEVYPDGPRYTVVMVADIHDRSTEQRHLCRDVSDALKMVEAFLRTPT